MCRSDFQNFNSDYSHNKYESKRMLDKINLWRVNNFFKIIDNNLVSFFEYDKCYRMTDKYLLAMVFIYFVRANLEPQEYTPGYFFAALYLALDMEEEDMELQVDLKMWIKRYQKIPKIHYLRDVLFRKMDYFALVCRMCCESVISNIYPEHKVWKRKRDENHSGALSDVIVKTRSCPKCKYSS